MTAPSSHRFVLVGPQAGQTLNLGGHQFIDGVYEFIYVVDGMPVLPSMEDVTHKARSLARNYQAYLEGSPELEEAKKALKGGKPAPEQGTLDVTEREEKEQQDAADQQVVSRQAKTKARNALLKLDYRDDAHWTDAGLPSVQAVRQIAGIDTISRADIAALAPNLTREEAKKVAGGAEDGDED